MADQFAILRLVKEATSRISFGISISVQSTVLHQLLRRFCPVRQFFLLYKYKHLLLLFLVNNSRKPQHGENKYLNYSGHVCNKCCSSHFPLHTGILLKIPAERLLKRQPHIWCKLNRSADALSLVLSGWTNIHSHVVVQEVVNFFFRSILILSKLHQTRRRLVWA